MTTKRNIVVIGSGFGGLAAACRLAAQGHCVQIFEKRDQSGGRAYQYEINGFKFDGGPTVITVPYMFDEIFGAAGRRWQDYFTLLPLDPFYRIFDHTGRAFNYRRDTEDMLGEIERWSPQDQQGYLRFLAATEKIFNTFRGATDTPFLSLGDMLKIIPDMIKADAMGGTYGFVSKFIRNDFLRRVFSFHPLLIGGNPLDTPSIFTIIAQFEKQWGVFYALGGTGAIVRGMVKLFEELGGKVHLNAEVTRIVTDKATRRVKGVQLADGSFHSADDVVCNGDVAHAYRTLIAPEHRRKYSNFVIDHVLQYSMSLFVIYFGTKRRYLDSQLAHHNIMLNQRYTGLLKDIFRGKTLPKDFSLYLHMPSKTDPSIAPEGCESFYVLSPVPILAKDGKTGRGQGIDWETQAQPYRDAILQYLQEHYLPDLQESIVAEHVVDPRHFRYTLNSHRGAAFGIKPILFQSSYMRPHNRSEEFSNLYFVGAGTHPGAGVPSVLSSGKIVANLIAQSVREEARQFASVGSLVVGR